MESLISTRIRGGLLGLGLLALVATAAPMPAAADPSATPDGGSSTPASVTPAPTPSRSVSYSLAPTAFSITVSPARLALGPDDADGVHPFAVVNRGQEAVGLQIQKRNFTPEPDGSMRFDRDAPYAAADWVEVEPASFTIEPGATQQVTATIERPNQAEPGDHNVALVVMVPAPEGDGNIKINRGVAAPVYIAVDGTTDNSVRLDAFTGPPISLTGDVPITTTVVNTGNTHRDFRGPTALTVTDGERSAAFPDFTVTRGATRVTRMVWDPPLVCVCRPTVSVENASGGVQTLSFRVVVFPWWLGIAVLAALSATTVAMIRRRRARPAAVAARAAAPDGG